MFFENDICWCANRNKCDNIDCFRHISNRKSAGIFITGLLMGTEYCENNKENNMERIVRVWIGNEYIEIEIEAREDWTEDDLLEAAVLYVYDNISVEVL